MRRPRLRGLGQWEDEGAWEDLSTPDMGDAPDIVEIVDVPSADYEPDPYPIERPPPQDEPDVYVYPIERPPPQDPFSYTTAQIEQAVSELVPPFASETPAWFTKAASNFIAALANAAPAVLKGLFPAGLPPIWTPCPSGTYWTGTACAPKPSSCPQGTYWTGSACKPWSLLDYIGGGGGEEGGGEGEFGESLPITAQWWFWPVLLGGGGLIVLVAVRRR